MATKKNPGEFDCYAAAGEDEPIFILRSTDIMAPLVLSYWAQLYKERKTKIGRYDERAQRKVKEARKTAEDMAEWYDVNIVSLKQLTKPVKKNEEKPFEIPEGWKIEPGPDEN